MSVADPGSALASVLELSTLATVGETLQEGISGILEGVEEIANGSEAALPELQIPDTFTEAMEEKAGAELDLSAADPEEEAPETPEAEAKTPEVETPVPEVEVPAAEEAEIPEVDTPEGEAEVPETPEAENPEVEAEAPEAEAPSVETAPGTSDDSENTETTEEEGTTRKASSGATGTGKYRPDRTWMKTATSSTTAAICPQD